MTESPVAQAPHTTKSRPADIADRLEETRWIEYMIPVPPVGGQMSKYSRVPPDSAGKSPGDKGPHGYRGFPGWQKHLTSKADVTRWLRDGCNLGVRTGAGLTIIDIDCDYPAITRALVVEYEAAFGTTLQRWRGPRVMLVYRTRAPASPKRIVDYADASGAIQFKEEHLGEGQQGVVGPGRHKSGMFHVTQTRERFLAALMRTPVASLPAVSGETLSTTGFAIAQKVAAEFGLVATLRSERAAREREGIDQAELLCPWSIERLSALVAFLPNEVEPAGGRDAYLKFGYAVKAACGAARYADGLEMFQEWAGRWSGPYDPDVTACDWDRMHAPFAVGFGWLLDQAAKNGFSDFAVVV